LTTQEYLWQIQRFERMITNKFDEIHKLRMILSGTSSIGNLTEKVQTSGNKDRIGSSVVKIVDMENEIDELIDKRYEIVRQIESLPDTQMYDVLAQRYVSGREMKSIQLCGVDSLRQVKRIHAKALDCFEKTYGELYL
jgi:hypothetical protein